MSLDDDPRPSSMRQPRSRSDTGKIMPGCCRMLITAGHELRLTYGTPQVVRQDVWVPKPCHVMYLQVLVFEAHPLDPVAVHGWPRRTATVNRWAAQAAGQSQ